MWDTHILTESSSDVNGKKMISVCGAAVTRQNVSLNQQPSARRGRRNRNIPYVLCVRSLIEYRNTYLSSLEDRLKRMESALMKSTHNQARRPSNDLGNQAIVDDMSLLKIHDNGTTVFVGMVSSFVFRLGLSIDVLRLGFWLLDILTPRPEMDCGKDWQQ